MYNIISIVLLIASLNCISYGMEWFGILLAGSVGFAIAGAIGSIGSKIDAIFNTKITWTKKDLIDGSSELEFSKVPYNKNNQQ